MGSTWWRWRVVRWGLGLAAACAALVLLVQGLALAAGPRLGGRPPPPDPADLAAVQDARRFRFDQEHPPRIQVEVDYEQGTDAAWYPKAQSPLLDPLVSEGSLPPVAQRVGPEPLVLRSVDGPGTYGGTYTGLGTNVRGAAYGMGAPTLLRWSPCGYPLVPHLAKAWTASEDSRTFTFTLRRGLRWSDGHPFTTADIAYFWEHEVNDPASGLVLDDLLKVRGRPAEIQILDELRFQVRFPESNALFLPLLASARGICLANSPAHYRRRYHPTIGEQDLIAREMRARSLPTPRALYTDICKFENPEHPRLWPWVYRTFQANPPLSIVRNPYYWAVDEQGRQLPYIDRLLIIQKPPDLASLSVASGEIPFAVLKIDQHPLIMANRERGRYRVLRWLRADASENVLFVNQNRRIDPRDPTSRHKAELLRNRDFRRALSLAIDRVAIVRANYFDEAVPAQVAPPPESPFYHERALTAWTAHDPTAANALLDAIGLRQRDSEGFRRFPDGSRMQFTISFAPWFWPSNAQFVVDDWAKVGVRAIPALRENRLFYTEKAAGLQDFTCFTGNNEFIPIIEPRCFVPTSVEANMAIDWARWYRAGGMHGHPDAQGFEAPPPDHPLRKAMELYDRIIANADPAKQRELMAQILDIAADEVFTIGLCTSTLRVTPVSMELRGVPERAVTTFDFVANCSAESWWFVANRDSPSAIHATQDEIRRVTPEPLATAATPTSGGRERLAGSLIRWLLVASAAALLLLAALRHPFVIRRLVILVPTLLVMSVAVFTIIELPPGDYLDSKIMEMEQEGNRIDPNEIQQLREQYHLGDNVPLRYVRWLGLPWFASLDAKDSGLLQGNLGLSMTYNRRVNDIVGDRILLTFLISLGTILLTWAVGIPAGIYSAVRQYSPGDYLLTTLLFVGMCIPSFIFAVILLTVWQRLFGWAPTGLFSARYAAQPEWSAGKILDLVGHIWVPIVILVATGTAGLIRTLRANLLDELRKPYVTTARAKGLRPLRVLLKYPVRMALNPFISGIGGLFPALISGAAILAIVLALPTVGPLMLEALLNEDTLLAGSMLMVLSLLSVLGTLVSDLLLLWLDPRIRLDGGQR